MRAEFNLSLCFLMLLLAISRGRVGWLLISRLKVRFLPRSPSFQALAGTSRTAKICGATSLLPESPKNLSLFCAIVLRQDEKEDCGCCAFRGIGCDNDRLDQNQKATKGCPRAGARGARGVDGRERLHRASTCQQEMNNGGRDLSLPHSPPFCEPLSLSSPLPLPC